MITRMILAAAGLAFLALLGTTLATQGLDGAEAVTGTAWGRVTLADFYLGVACFALVIHAVERRITATVGWTLALALGGYPVAVVWLLLRGLPRLERIGELSRERDPPGPS
jgi:hypothetical protein